MSFAWLLIPYKCHSGYRYRGECPLRSQFHSLLSGIEANLLKLGGGGGVKKNIYESLWGLSLQALA
jgi:hypothetical protein